MARVGGRLAFAAALVAAASCGPAWAAGDYIQEQSARAAGRAYAGEAADSGLESLWWNPAAVAWTRRAQAAGGVEAVIPGSHAIDGGSTIQRPGQAAAPVGGPGRLDGALKPGPIPGLGVAVPLGERVVVAVSAAAPFNITGVYDGTGWTRYDAIKSRITDVDLAFTGAVRLTDRLSLGAGIDAQYASATLTSALPNLSPLLPDGGQRLSGDGWNVGWSLGAQWRANEAVTLGVSYRSAIRHRLTGQASVSGLLGPLAGSNGTLAAQARFQTPWIATAAVRWRVGPRLTLDAQVQRFGWSRFDAITVSLPTGVETSVQGYRDTTTVAVGLDYQVTDATTLRAGVQRDPTPTPDPGRGASVPDGDRWLFGAGLSHRLSDHARLDLNADYIAIADSPANRTDVLYAGTPAATTVNLRGTVGGHALVFGAGVGWSF